MINPSVVFTGILSMLLLMIPGFLVVKTKLISASFAKEISKIVLYAAQPCMIIAAFLRPFNADILSSMLKMFILSLVAYIIIYLIVFKMFGKTPVKQRSVLRYMMIFSNCGFMGFPMLKAILGEEVGNLAILYGAMLTIWFNIFAWTLGMKFYSVQSEKVRVKELILNPGVVGVIIGLIIFFSSAVISVPSFLQGTAKAAASSIRMLGEIVTPFSMIVIGMRLSEMQTDNVFKEKWTQFNRTKRLLLTPAVFISSIFKDKKMLFAHVMRLILLPAVVFILLRLVILTGFIEKGSLVITVIFILLAMPSATNTVMMAELYDGDSVYASGAVTLSTLLSLVTIPLMSLLLLIP